MKFLDADFASLNERTDLKGYGIYLSKYLNQENVECYNMILMINESSTHDDLIAVSDLDLVIESSGQIEHSEDELWISRRITNARYYNEITRKEEKGTLNIIEQKGYYSLNDTYSILYNNVTSKIQQIQSIN